MLRAEIHFWELEPMLWMHSAPPRSCVTNVQREMANGRAVFARGRVFFTRGAQTKRQRKDANARLQDATYF